MGFGWGFARKQRRDRGVVMPGDSELHKAAKDGLTDDCSEIIGEGKIKVDAPGAQGRTALHRALGGGHIECANKLIEHGADLTKMDSMKRTSLHWAVMASCSDDDCFKCVTLVMEHEASQTMLNAQSKSQSTPLHCAITSGREAVAQMLLEAGADPSIKDEDDKTAQVYARCAFSSPSAAAVPPLPNEARSPLSADWQKTQA